jgi:hypothetical protein
MFSCRQQVVERPVFKKIDLSWGNGWTKYICVNIDSLKTARILVDELNKKPIYLVGKLNDTIFSKLNYLVGSALNQKYPDMIGESLVDGGASHIIIDNNIHSTINASAEQNKLDTIVSLLIDLNNYTLKPSVDSTFVYKSLSKIKPTLETVKFVPPVIKDDVIEK